ncbi:MAG TPA: AMP-binding protein [Verrucomicrobiales bacterium]|nr:AMP-binding protein [Verrucomicrobiales bacterium]
MARPRSEQLEQQRAEIRSAQWDRLAALLDTILNTNPFYQRRISHLTINSLGDFVRLCPLLTKRMLVADREANPPYGTNLTYPLENYTRFCQTSGTTGPPLSWLDSRDDWGGMLQAWQEIFDTAALEPGEDRLFFPFSFGPFLGFWTAFEAATRLGCMVIPGGGMSTNARLQLMLDHRISVVVTTPTYALHMGDVKEQSEQFRDANFALRLIIVAGETGGSQPAIRERMEKVWPGAFVFDHHGLTETGPVSCQVPGVPGCLRVLEDFHFAEILDPASGAEVMEGEQGELVITTLTRLGGPMLRYRTGDLVRKRYADNGALCLDGGIIGRLDDMVSVHGVNIYPSAVDAILRRFPEVVEYQVREHRTGALLDLKILVEVPAGARDAGLAERISSALRDSFQVRIDVQVVAPGTLPRFEFKSRRWIKETPPRGKKR